MSDVRERGGPPQESHHPTAQQIVAFNEACLQVKDVSNEEQWAKFAKAAEEMKKAGWIDAQVVAGLWNVRPDVRPANRTPEETVEMALQAEAAERQRRTQARTSTTDIYPLGQTVSELEFHSSVIQRAALYGAQLVARTTELHPTIHNLPGHILPADPRLPFYLQPGELFRAPKIDKK